MEKARRAMFFLLLLIADFSVAQDTAGEADEFHVGVILDLGSLVGKVARTSVLLAAQDFYTVHRNYSTKLVLHVVDSAGSDVQAASAVVILSTNLVKLEEV
uniref:Receptor ligand binding region domain-containing protein n=1 Tax=Aegilops tauschii TaxID=37682 RepID=M8BXL4_AEGTA